MNFPVGIQIEQARLIQDMLQNFPARVQVPRLNEFLLGGSTIELTLQDDIEQGIGPQIAQSTFLQHLGHLRMVQHGQSHFTPVPHLS